MTSELEQLHEMETFSPPDDNKLTNKDRVGALASLVFLIEKGVAELKGEHVQMVENNYHT